MFICYHTLYVYHRCHGAVCCASVFNQLDSWLTIVSFHVTVHSMRAQLSSVFPPQNRISDHKYWTCFIFTIWNWGGPDRLPSKSGRVKSILTHLTPQENLAGLSLEPSDNWAFWFWMEGKYRAQNQPNYLVVCTSLNPYMVFRSNWPVLYFY